MKLQPGDWVRLRNDAEYRFPQVGQVEEVDDETVQVVVRFEDGDRQKLSPIDLLRLGA